MVIHLHRDVNVGVPHDMLQDFDVHPVFRHSPAERMAHGVCGNRRERLFRFLGIYRLDDVGKDFIYGIHQKRSAVPRDENEVPFLKFFKP